jgi:hypothetical protein
LSCREGNVDGLLLASGSRGFHDLGVIIRGIARYVQNRRYMR